MSHNPRPRRTWCSILIALLVMIAAAEARAQTPAPATAEAERFWIAGGGAFQDSREEFATRVTFTRYFETGLLDGQYETRGGPLVDVSGGIPLRWGFGLQGGGSVMIKSHRGVLRGSVPHPLYFAQPRHAEIEVGDLAHREIAVRAEIAWTRPVWSNVQISISGGPAAVHLRQAIFAGEEPAESNYPFDTIDLAPATAALSGWGLGGTAAVDVTWFVRKRVGVGLTGRVTRATVDLEQIKLSVGGAAAIAGVRFLVH